MAHPDVGATAHEPRPSAVPKRLGGLGIVAVLGVAVLGSAAGGPEWLVAWVVTAALLVVTGGAIVARVLGSGESGYGSDLDRYRVLVLLVSLVGLLAVVYQSRSPGYGAGLGRTASAVLVFLALAAVCVLARDPREYSVLQWVVIGGVLTVVGIFFYHSVSVAEVSLRSRHPVWGGTVMAVGLVVLPQYVSRSAFLWAVSRVSAVLVLLALPVYVIGEYTLFGLSFGFMGAYTIPVVGVEVPATRSLFVNRNAFGVVVFAGFVSAVVEAHRSYVRERTGWTLLVATALLVINGVGLALSFGRALWVITPMAIGVYLGYVIFGWRAVPVAVIGGFVYLVSGIAAVQSGLIPLPEGTPTRVERWYPALAALGDQGSLLGAGLIDPGEFYAPYQGGAEYSPHNSYLTMGIRAGLLGGFVYGIMIGSSLLAGLLGLSDADDEARVGLVALAVGFAAHQVFEAYTLFNWGSSTVLAVLVFGLLVFGRTDHFSKSSLAI